MEKDIESLSFIRIVNRHAPHLLHILTAIHMSCKIIQREISKAGIIGLHGIVDSAGENASGDIQKKLDVISNDIMIDHLIHSNSCSLLLSEENEDVILVPEEHRGDYMVTFDPLDGSSNIDCNCCVGTIFSIFHLPKQNEYKETDYLKKGEEMICAGYVLYGPSTEMVITFEKGSGLYRFTLDQSIGEFICTGKIQIPKDYKKIYSINESNWHSWRENVREFITQYKIKNTKYTQRYIGSMVADVHRTLLYGGMFMYPSDEKNKDGKLRIMYECFPMARLVEEAGGEAITDDFYNTRVLDLTPNHIHQKIPLLLGNSEEIIKFKKINNCIKCK